MTIAPGDSLGLTAALVRVDSRNPTLVPGAPGERECARVLADVLRAWGFAVEVVDAAPRRPNVIARLAPPIGVARGRSLLLNGHLDVVGTDGMTHAPFDGEARDGRLWGRGSADMKGGIAAMCAAAVRARDAGALRGEVIVTAVADEEYGSLGTRALVESGVRADAAIVTEPTRLRVMPAHKGFAWLTVTVRGHAAHGSRWELGVDAIRHAGLLLAELDALDAEELPRRTAHPLLGRPSLHASLIGGGSGLSTYPDRCVLRLERRTIPGESADAPLHEVRAACERVRARRPSFDADVTLDLEQPPSDVAAGAPIVRALVDALGAVGEPPTPLEGMSAWTDAALLNGAGIPAVCFGPGDIALAHADTEYVPVDEIERATAALAELVARWC
ncbi:acetylornithine deacetylase or succinyl-diaminopimelate desuccinylase [Gemmatirosa kalamazoonensis]|uniref:Probable succinyl-diaminopimelate desuccinylase n=1 Tax=Gemmatirosa kalamazoonensis TaxID=861299 RepID=W0RGK1_9BACT|nr:ArgE/DapE family deacylase [Gemmatirosa kalamazoonensis]AHG89911.1 acetylornithine deacetylase or succinyl-diaminopimelate desuccinylase [Gemmatirosa kalamazoonensis]